MLAVCLPAASIGPHQGRIAMRSDASVCFPASRPLVSVPPRPDRNQTETRPTGVFRSASGGIAGRQVKKARWGLAFAYRGGHMGSAGRSSWSVIYIGYFVPSPQALAVAPSVGAPHRPAPGSQRPCTGRPARHERGDIAVGRLRTEAKTKQIGRQERSCDGGASATENAIRGAKRRGDNTNCQAEKRDEIRTLDATDIVSPGPIRLSRRRNFYGGSFCAGLQYCRCRM